MYNLANRDRVDSLIEHFWRNGYMTLSRKFGTYLPEPQPIGKYNVDAIGKYKKKYAIGIILSKEELDDPAIFNKLNFLAKRNMKFPIQKITLFVGVPKKFFDKAKLLIANLNEEVRNNIKLIGLTEDKLRR